MSQPPTDRLRLQELEDRSLLSADIVVSGTDGHDVITLNRVDRYQVEVTVQSFRDAAWTEPTDDPARHFEIQLSHDQLTSTWESDIVPAIAVLALTTTSIRVEAGGGTDRIDIIDRFTPFHYFSGTYRTDDPPAGESELPMGGWLRDEAGSRWASDPEFAVAAVLPFYESTLTEGVDMAAGADVAVRFNDLFGWWDEPIWYEPLPADVDAIAGLPEDLAGVDPSFDPAGLELLIAGGEEDWAATATGPWLDGEPGPDGWSDEAVLDDLWVEAADDFVGDAWDAAGDADEGSDWLTGEGMDDWLGPGLEG